MHLAALLSDEPRKAWPSRAKEAQLWQQRADVHPQGVEDLGAEAILLPFGFPDEITHRRRAEATKESEDRALLNHSRRMSVND